MLRCVAAVLAVLGAGTGTAQPLPGMQAAAAASAAAPAGQSPVPAMAASAPAAPAVAQPHARLLPIPRLQGRLRPADLGLVINTADPYSVAVGAYYRRARALGAAQVLEVELPLRSALTPQEFAQLQQRIEAHFGASIQALALAWSQPYAVACNSLPGALALGFDAALCAHSCGASTPSPYFNSPSARPWRDHALRPAMLLAAPDVPAALALIDRGVAADGALLRPGRPPVTAALLTSPDRARGVRERLYPPPGLLRGPNVEVQVVPAEDLPSLRHVVLAHTGSARVALDPPPQWAPGGLGDHLTSVGGALQGGHGQSTVLEWLASGAVASHGAVSEPCNHLQKFPHPLVLLGHYLQGATALEAYWKSVAWPQQSLFVGEPLAAPFAAGPSAR